MKYPWAVPGQKVTMRKHIEWVVTYMTEEITPPPAAVFGIVYQIENVYPNAHGPFCDCLHISLTELSNLAAYNVNSFRPMFPQTVEDDIKLFAPWLNVTKEKDLIDV